MVYRVRLRGVQRRLWKILGSNFCSEGIKGLTESGLKTENFGNRHSWLESYGDTRIA